MSTETPNSESQKPVSASGGKETQPGSHPDPDRPIEGAGGPSDTGSGGHTGSNPPPAQTY